MDRADQWGQRVTGAQMQPHKRAETNSAMTGRISILLNDNRKGVTSRMPCLGGLVRQSGDAVSMLMRKENL